MSIVLAMVDGGRGDVVVASDTLGLLNGDVKVQLGGKIWRDGPFIVGFTGTWAQLGVAKRTRIDVSNLDVANPDDVEAEERTLAAHVKTVRNLLGFYGDCTVITNNEQAPFGLLYARGTRIWISGSAGALYRPSRQFDAIGSGASFALGALSVPGWSVLDPRRRVETALAIAESWSAGVGLPGVVLTTGGDDWTFSG